MGEFEGPSPSGCLTISVKRGKMLRVKKKGRMDRDVGEREGLRAEATAQHYGRGFYDSGVIAGLKTETVPDVKPRGTLLTDPNFLETQGGLGQVTVKKRSGFDEFGRGVGIGTRGLVHGVSNVAEPLRQGMNSVNTLLGGSPDYFPPVGDRVGDWLGLPKQ